MSKIKLLVLVLIGAFLVGCAAKVPMDTFENDQALKEFPAPPSGKAGVYVYRDSFLGKALVKRVDVNGKTLGNTAPDVFFYTVVDPGPVTVATQSEFSDNILTFDAIKDHNYFIRQYIKMGVFVGGADLEIIDEEKGKTAVLKTKLALSIDKQ